MTLLFSLTQNTIGQTLVSSATDNKQICEHSATLSLGGILSCGISRDQGVSPIIYHLLALTPYTALTIDNGQWKFEAALSLSANIQAKNYKELTNLTIHGFGADVTYTSGFEYNIYKKNRWRIGVGLSGAGWLMAAYNNNYFNACVGLSILVAPLATSTIEWNSDKLSTHLRCRVSPIGWWYRPGFAYISNYSTGQSEITTFDDEYQWSLAPFPLIETQIGIDYHFKNRHSIGIAYTWQFFTTRQSGNWTYEAARHHLHVILQLDL